MTRVRYAALEPTLSAPARAFWSEPLRARPAAAALGVALRFGSYREGLRAALEEEGWSPEDTPLAAVAVAPAPAPAAAAAPAKAAAPTVAPMAPAALATPAAAAPAEAATAASAVVAAASAPPTVAAASPLPPAETPPKKKQGARAPAAASPASLAAAVEVLQQARWRLDVDALERRVLRRAWSHESAEEAGKALGRLAKSCVEMMMVEVVSRRG